MKPLYLILLLLFSSLVSSQSACTILGTTDTNAFNSWYNGGASILTTQQKAAVRAKLGGITLSSTVQTNEPCASAAVGTGNIVCQSFDGQCYITSLSMDDIGTATNSKLSFFPTPLYGLTRLSTLVLSSNRLTTIPTTINSFSALQFFSINSNLITSTIPTQLAAITTLQLAELSNNQIPGTLPVSNFNNHPSLQSFSVSNNKLSGTIPTEWSTISTLSTFTADAQTPASGSFGGTIPTQWSSLSISTFSVNNNQVTGTLPSQWTSGALALFDVSSNQITGTIPTQLGVNSNLNYLRINSNSISGTIPTEFATFVPYMLDNFGELVADSNQLVGTIPYELMAFPEDSRLYGILNLDNNLLCPKVDYSTWADQQDYVKGCDMCALSLNNTSPLELCDSENFFVCFTNATYIAEETFECVLNLTVPYYVYSETKSEANGFSSSSSGMKIRFVGSGGTTSSVSYRSTGYAAGAKHNQTVLADKSVGTVWSIYITFDNPQDFWHVDVIKVYHQGQESIYAPRTHNVAVRNNDLLEAEFTLTVQTNSVDGTAAKVYAVLKDNRGYQQNLNFNEAAPPGSTLTRTLRGYNLNDIPTVYLGHYSQDTWTVDSLEITKRGVTTTYLYNVPISRYNRPLPQSSTSG